MAHVPQDLLDRIAALEREVRMLRGRAQIRPAMDQILGGDVIIGEGGQLIAQTPEGTRTLQVGQTPEGDWGVGIARAQGPRALTVGDDDANPGSQMIRLWARSGSVIVMDDAYADDYLGRPWVPIPMAPSQAVTSSSWVTAFAGEWRVQHAVLSVTYSIAAPAGTTCEARLVVGAGSTPTQLGDTITATGTERFAAYRITPSEHGLEHATAAALRIQARRTAGTGTGTCWCQGIWGMNTVSPDEA